MATNKGRAPRRGHGWTAKPGLEASYTGKTSKLLRGGRRVRIVAQAAKERMTVMAIGLKGKPVQITVAAKNLGQPQPDLFDQLATSSPA